MAEWVKSKVSEEKAVVQLDYDMYEREDGKEELQVMLEKLALLLTVPTQSVKLADKMMESWNRELKTMSGIS